MTEVGTPGNGRENRIPTHPDILRVEYNDGNYTSRAVTLIDLEPHQLFASMDGYTPTKHRTYATVQSGKNADIDLNTDLVYCNHSCEPNVVFDMERFEVRAGDRHIKAGDELTFFYPSSEWDMSQPFDCRCGSSKCLGSIQGAKHVDPEIARRYWLNKHIQELMAERSN